MAEPKPKLINPQDVDTLEIVADQADEDCTPCQLLKKHLGNYKGKVTVIHPLSAEAERYWKEDKVEFPVARVKMKDGQEVPCELFMDEYNLVAKCEDKILVIAEPTEELVELAKTENTARGS